jgi:hypothetical protein
VIGAASRLTEGILVYARRYLVRLFSGGTANWSADNRPDDSDLAKRVFNLADREQSVYEVADGEQECFAVAAHKLTDPRKGPDAMSVLRIDRDDLPSFGISVVENQFGTTGIPRWDCRHRNLLADREQFIKFVGFLAERCHRGHDQVRRIEKNLVVRSLNSICVCSPRECPDHVKRIAASCQNKTRPDLSIKRIEQELDAVEFEDEVIRPAAQRLGSGDQVRDWYCALDDIRRSYRESYLIAIAKRFGLQGPGFDAGESVLVELD